MIGGCITFESRIRTAMMDPVFLFRVRWHVRDDIDILLAHYRLLVLFGNHVCLFYQPIHFVCINFGRSGILYSMFGNDRVYIICTKRRGRKKNHNNYFFRFSNVTLSFLSSSKSNHSVFIEIMFGNPNFKLHPLLHRQLDMHKQILPNFLMHNFNLKIGMIQESIGSSLFS